MDANVIVQLIGSLGFPIVACVAMFLQNEKQDLRHQEESAKFAEALNNNTLALTKLSGLVEQMEKKDE